MKRRNLSLTFILLAFALCSCGGGASPEAADETVRIGAMKGATAIGLAKYIEDAPDGVSFEVVTADEIVPLLVRGGIDMAAVPANLAATLYNNTDGAIRVAAVNLLGLNYIVETGGEIQSVGDLRGKTVVAVGKGTTPEITLRHILTQNGLDPGKDVTLEFRNEPGEVVAWLKQNGGAAMLPQPFVTTAMDNVEGLREALDLTVEWDKLGSPGTLVTGVFVVRASFIEEYPEMVRRVMESYCISLNWVNDYPAEAAPFVEKLGIASADVAERAIPKCHLVFLEGAEMRETLEAFYSVLFEAAPGSIGGAMPDDGFYYVP